MDLSVEGTKIVGEFMETTVKKLGKALGSVTVAGKDLIEYVGLLAKTSKQLGEAGINIWGVTVAPDSMTFFIEEESVEKATKVLHEFVLHDAKAVSVTSSKGIGLVYVTSSSFLDEPGALGRITGAIAEAKLNIKEVTTSKSQIMVFVDYKDIDTVYEIVNLLYRKKK
jgi:aspartokinase